MCIVTIVYSNFMNHDLEIVEYYMLEDIYTEVEAFCVGTFDSSFICGATDGEAISHSEWGIRKSCSSVKLVSSHNGGDYG